MQCHIQLVDLPHNLALHKTDIVVNRILAYLSYIYGHEALGTGILWSRSSNQTGQDCVCVWGGGGGGGGHMFCMGYWHSMILFQQSNWTRLCVWGEDICSAKVKL